MTDDEKAAYQQGRHDQAGECIRGRIETSHGAARTLRDAAMNIERSGLSHAADIIAWLHEAADARYH